MLLYALVFGLLNKYKIDYTDNFGTISPTFIQNTMHQKCNVDRYFYILVTNY